MTNTTAPVRTHRARKALIPLATLLVASALAVGSGATFTSASHNTISSVTSGTLTHSNSKQNEAIFTATDIKPGDSVTGTLKITNTGTLPADFSLTEAASVNGFTGEDLTLTITDATKDEVVYAGTFGGLVDGTKNALDRFAAGEARDYTFVVTLDGAADDTNQGKTASATFNWDAVQVG